MNNFVKRFLVSILVAPLILIFIYAGGIYFNILLIALLIFGFYEISLIKKSTIKFLILAFFIFFIFTLYDLRNLNDKDGYEYLFFCILITWLSDSGGYIFGKILKGKKINIISPNKTYAGFLGSLALPQVISIYFFLYNSLIFKTFDNISLYVLFFSIMSVIGDLFFSYIKRILNIKDFSNLIPGHGGLFDRIDSLIFVVLTFSIIK